MLRRDLEVVREVCLLHCAHAYDLPTPYPEEAAVLHHLGDQHTTRKPNSHPGPTGSASGSGLRFLVLMDQAPTTGLRR